MIRSVLVCVLVVGAALVTDERIRAQETSDVPVVVGSKPFGESYLLGELFAQILEARGVAVTRRFGLGGTEILFPALVAGQIDVYPEYTGSGLRVILGHPPLDSSSAVFDFVSREFAARHDLRWLAPLGFENTYAMSVRADMADELGLRTLSDFAAVSGRMRAGLTADFIGLPDGMPALRRAYGIAPREVNALAPAVKYEALVSGAVDIIDAYSTDGLLARYPVVVLEDDRRVFPPYDAAALMRGEVVRHRPEAVAALAELSGRFDETRMRHLNGRVEVGGEDVSRVAADALGQLALTDSGVSPDAGSSARADAREGLGPYLWSQRRELARMTGRHLLLVTLSLGLGVLVAVPLGVLLERVRAAEGVIRSVGVLQTVPSLALLAFMIPLFGIGVRPAVVALFLYTPYPIVRNTYTGVRGADPGAVEAGRALGMTDAQVLGHIRLPLAAPVIMAGVRTAAVLGVGTATLAALIGAGGLGDPIVAGLALADTRMILSGAIPAALLAVVVDTTLGVVQRLLVVSGRE